jgi:hypothetical protein
MHTSTQRIDKSGHIVDIFLRPASPARYSRSIISFCYSLFTVCWLFGFNFYAKRTGLPVIHCGLCRNSERRSEFVVVESEGRGLRLQSATKLMSGCQLLKLSYKFDQLHGYSRGQLISRDDSSVLLTMVV